MAKRFVNTELINPVDSPFSPYFPTFNGRVMLSSQDRVLIDNGAGGSRSVDLYSSLFLNPVVHRSWTKLMDEICHRDLVAVPADDSEYAKLVADDILEQIKMIGQSGATPLLSGGGGFDEMTRTAGKAYITGMSPLELVWARDNTGKRIVKYAKARDPKLFRMEYDAESRVTRPRLLTRQDMLRGSALPAHKIVLHRYWAVPGDDEYGCGLGRNLYYPVEWQKQIMSYWLMLIDKTVMPSTVGSYSKDARTDEDKIAIFEEAVRNFGQDSSITLPPGYSIEVHDLKGSSSADMLDKLLTRIDEYLEMLIIGESTTGKSGGGEGGVDQVADSIFTTKAKSLSDSISSTFNATLVKWLVWAQYGKDAPVPTIWRSFAAEEKGSPTNLNEVESVETLITLLGQLDQQGLTLDPAWVQGRLGAPLKSLMPKPKPATPPTGLGQ
jgi:phage gp29-like protein